MTEKLTVSEIQELRDGGWRVYNSESVKYDYLAVREIDGKTILRHIKRQATK